MFPNTPARLAFAMNSPDHQCGAPQICLQLDEQRNSFPNSIVSVIVSSDVYHQFRLMHKWESILYDCIGIIIGIIIFQNVNVRRMTL